MSTQLTPDDAKRLLSCMQIGVLIQNQDGHRWIDADGIDYRDGEPDGGERDAYGLSDTMPPLNWLLREKGLEEIRCKQYGSLRNCLDVIDTALQSLGISTLREMYDTGGDYMWGFEGTIAPAFTPMQNVTCPACARDTLVSHGKFLDHADRAATGVCENSGKPA